MIQIHQRFDGSQITNLVTAVVRQIKRQEMDQIIRTRGPRVAIGVGSRGIDGIDIIVKAVIDHLKARGCQPFLVPAMGSHGGATPEGQLTVLEELGISQKTMGVPIDASMETVHLGTSVSGIPVHLAKAAWEADWILPINRIKPHTDFEGSIQSGLCKLLAIGLGKHTGCMAIHAYGTENFGGLLPELFEVFLGSGRVGFGLGIVENAYDKPLKIRAIAAQHIPKEEVRLLMLAKERMASIMLREIDVLVVEEFGKNISGAGMDTNITGRTSTGPKRDYHGPDIKRIVVSRLSEATHGNACAISCADFITRCLFEQIDLEATYTNSLSCYNPPGGKIPIIARDEETAIAMAVSSIPGCTPAQARIVRIKNTIELGNIWISESVLPQIQGNPLVSVCQG